VANEVVVKVVNTSKQEQSITLNLKDLSGATTAKTITLSHKGMDDENSIERPEFITPKQGTVAVEAGKKQSVINDQLAPMSFRIYRIAK
jgi:alpha-L-arabinofuranosidase